MKSSCEGCLPGYDPDKNCSECVKPSYDLEQNCSECLFGYNSTTDCAECMNGHWDGRFVLRGAPSLIQFHIAFDGPLCTQISG